MKEVKTIAIIPARGGSKRLPGKNLLPLGSKPLIQHSIDAALASRIFDAVVVSTDDAAIKAASLSAGALVVDRPESLSGDLEPTVTAVAHVLEQFPSAETVVLLQPTNPIRPFALIGEGLAAFQASGRDSLFTVSRNHHKLGRISEDRFHPYNYEPGQRSQDLEPLYFENGLLYISRASVIRKGQIMSADALPFIIPDDFPIADIDTLQDFEYAEFLYQKYISS